jgi:DNA-binding winged helix-turn-helix (wHTH) protein
MIRDKNVPADSGKAPLLRWHFAGNVLDESSLELRMGGLAVRLPRKSLLVLQHLLQHAGEVVTKDELAESCWPGRVLSDTVLTTTLNRLRHALGDGQQELIKTVHGFGYRLVAAVKVEDAGETVAARLELSAGDHPPLRPTWSLVERLGAGSSGEVWCARHDKTAERRVYKFAVDGRALQGLKREITLFRLLKDALGDRADLTRILDWNLEQAPFFIEAELVAGGNLRQWAQALGGLNATPLAMRLELLAQCADTLAAAHSVGVLHKDLKPSNVLVVAEPDAPPRIKLCDFGSGGVLDAARFGDLGITRLGFTATIVAQETTSGTPLYLPPEAQAGQPQTAQGDIYALGVMLYQAVVGNWDKPLAAGWEREVPDDLLRADIAAAVDGDPDRRLANAGELARRLRQLGTRRMRLEADKSAAVRLIELQKKVERTQWRRRWMTGTAAVLALGLVSTLGLYFKLLGTERQRESALQQAQSEARRAESEGKRATAIKDFLIDVFRINDPRIASDRGHGSLTAKELLDIGSERIKRDFAADPPTQIELLGVTASIFDEIGEHQRYSALHDDYAALTRTHYGERSPRYITAVLDAAEHEIRYGDASKQRQLLDQADVLLREAGLDHSALRGRWWVLMDIDNEPTPEESRRALNNARQLLSPADHEVYYRLLYFLAADAISNRDPAAAEKYARQEIALISADAGYHGDHELRKAYHLLGDAQNNQANIRGSGESYKKSMDLAVQTYGYNVKTMTSIVDYADFLHGQGERAAAMALFERLWQAVPSAGAPDLNNYLYMRSVYAGCLTDEGRPQLAIPILEEAQRHFVQHDDYGVAVLPTVTTALGSAYLVAGRKAEAELTLKTALDQSIARLAADDDDLLEARDAWARSLLSRNDPAAAETQFQLIVEHAHDAHKFYAALAHAGLARAALQRHDVAAALEHSSTAVAIIDSFKELRDERGRPYVWNIRAESLLAQGDPHGAINWARRAVEANRRYDDPASPDLRDMETTLLAAQRAAAAVATALAHGE